MEYTHTYVRARARVCCSQSKYLVQVLIFMTSNPQLYIIYNKIYISMASLIFKMLILWSSGIRVVKSLSLTIHKKGPLLHMFACHKSLGFADLKFQVSTSVVLWGVMPCSFVRYLHFRGTGTGAGVKKCWKFW
jgi:hypothetical protein